MGCATRLITEAKYNDIINAINKHYEVVKNTVKNDGDWGFWGRIRFFVKVENGEKEDRLLYLSRCHYTEDLGNNVQCIKGKTFYLSLGCWGKSVEIMTTLAKEVGGYVNHNDCAEVDENYWKRYLSKNVEDNSVNVLEEIIHHSYGNTCNLDMGLNSTFVNWVNNSSCIVEDTNGKRYKICIESVD